MTTINDYLPKNIIVEQGEPSIEFFNEFYRLDGDDKMLQFLIYIVEGVIITAPKNNLFKHLNTRIDQNIATEIYYSAEGPDCKFLRISKFPNIKPLQNDRLTLIIIYAFFENQFFPSVERVLTTKLDELQTKLNNLLQEKFNIDAIDKNLLVVLINRIVMNIFFNTLILSIPNEISYKLYNLTNIDKYITSVIYPYVSICKSKYIRIIPEFKEMLYKEIIYNLNDESIQRFLNKYYIRKENIFKDIPLSIKKYLKERLISTFNITNSIRKFWKCDNIYYTYLEDIILSVNDSISLTDQGYIAILLFIHEELSILAVLKYIILYKRYCDNFHIKDTNLQVLGELIAHYNLTDIHTYDSFCLNDKDMQFIKEQIPILNDILSNIVLSELACEEMENLYD